MMSDPSQGRESVRERDPASASVPPRPEHVLRQKLLDDPHLTQADLARAIGISTPRMSMILNGRCKITLEIALRVEKVFGIPADFWTRAVAEFELYQERLRISAELEKLSPLSKCAGRDSSARLLFSAQ